MSKFEMDESDKSVAAALRDGGRPAVAICIEAGMNAAVDRAFLAARDEGLHPADFASGLIEWVATNLYVLAKEDVDIFGFSTHAAKKLQAALLAADLTNFLLKREKDVH